MIESVKNEVEKLLGNDDSGHDKDHINRVLVLSLRFAKSENADEYITALIALLHDVDDYKLFGLENEKNLSNARNIMNICNIDSSIQKKVCEEIRNIGYSKRLKGLAPTTIEGKIVSDADMCDALGAVSILRVLKYTTKMNKPFFDKNIFPIENMTSDKYKRKCADTGICHFYEKVLLLKDLMLTNSGREEAQERHSFVVKFLYQYFKEENAEEWIEYTNKFLKKVK